jgi:hypothetical protein
MPVQEPHDICLLESMFVEALKMALSKGLDQSLQLLKPKYRHAYREQWPDNPMLNHCYASCEAARQWMLEVAGVEYQPIRGCMPNGIVHWALRHPDGHIFDPSGEQFEQRPDYTQMKDGGFLTKDPSRRGEAILQLVGEYFRGVQLKAIVS